MYPSISMYVSMYPSIHQISNSNVVVPATPGQAHPHQHLGHVDFKLEPSVCTTTRKCAPKDQYLFLVNMFVS